jgi:hypothetical protein
MQLFPDILDAAMDDHAHMVGRLIGQPADLLDAETARKTVIHDFPVRALKLKQALRHRFRPNDIFRPIGGVRIDDQAGVVIHFIDGQGRFVPIPVMVDDQMIGHHVQKILETVDFSPVGHDIFPCPQERLLRQVLGQVIIIAHPKINMPENDNNILFIDQGKNFLILGEHVRKNRN